MRHVVPFALLRIVCHLPPIGAPRDRISNHHPLRSVHKCDLQNFSHIKFLSFARFLVAKIFHSLRPKIQKALALSAKPVQFYGAVSGHSSSSSLSFPFLARKSSSRSSSIIRSLPTSTSFPAFSPTRPTQRERERERAPYGG